MGKKSAPAAPDYTAAAEAQANSSQQAQTRADWANRPTQTTPWGTSSWNATAATDPATGEPITQWSQNIQLSPQQQQSLDAQMGVQLGQSQIAQGMLGRLNDSYQQQMDWEKFNPYGSAAVPTNLNARYTGAGPQMGATNTQATYTGATNSDPTGFMTTPQGQLDAGPRMSVDPNSLQPMTIGEGNQTQANTLSGAGVGIQQNVGGLQQAMPQADAAERQRIENAMFDRMRPQQERQQAGLEGKLANMGLTRGSEAWNREMERLGQQQSGERYDALMRGGEEMQRLHGMGMQNRQQDWGEQLGRGQFSNAAQAQGFGQAAQQGQQNFNQQAQANQDNYNRMLQSAGFNFDTAQRAGAQNFQQQLGANQYNFDTAARARDQNFQQQLQSNQANWGNLLGANQQNWQQALGSNNQNFNQQLGANQQNWAQALGANQYNLNSALQTNQQNFGMDQTAGNQNFQQQMAMANYQNQLRQQQIAEAMQQRNQPLNEVNALLTGQQVGSPQMPNFNTSQSAGGTNYMGAAQNQYGAALDKFNAGQAGLSGMMSGLGSLGSLGFMMSDRRLKSNIVKVGEHPIGVGIYEYDIFGQRQRGVIAQEVAKVAPERVRRGASGYLHVDYRGL